MDWISWDHTLKTGHARMDAEHRELAELFNLLRDAVESGKGKVSCAKVLDNIIQHAQTRVKPWIIALSTMLLAACASYSGSGLKPGEARLEDVQGLMGPPAMRWQEPDGSVRLAYPRGPLGFHTFMVMLGPNGRLQSIANVLEEESFARIRAGMTKEQVLRVLGPPDYSLSIYFKARDELVWDWRYCQIFGSPARFLVLFDGTSGAVRSTMTQSEVFERPRFMEHCSR